MNAEYFEIKEFVGHEENYKKLQKFWASTLKQISGLKLNPYIQNAYGNGEEITDGNPIISSLHGIKGIRIIQSEETEFDNSFDSWFDEIEIEGERITELVISLELNFLSYSTTKKIVDLFLKDKLTYDILENYNKKFKIIENE